MPSRVQVRVLVLAPILKEISLHTTEKWLSGLKHRFAKPASVRQSPAVGPNPTFSAIHKADMVELADTLSSEDSASGRSRFEPWCRHHTHYAGVAELADAAVLKTAETSLTCRFESCLRHQAREPLSFLTSIPPLPILSPARGETFIN